MPQIPQKRPHIQWHCEALSSLSAVFLVSQVYVAKAFYVLVYRPAPQPAFFVVFPPFSRLISYSKRCRKHLFQTLQKARGFYLQTMNSLASLKTALNGQTLRSANLGVSKSRPKQSESLRKRAVKHVLSNGKMY